MASQGKLISMQVGQPREMGTPCAEDPMDRPWVSAIFKEPVQGKRFLSTTLLEGDAQYEKKHHGGVDKAVNVYASEHYPFWREAIKRPDFDYGAFGENFTVAGMLEDEVCIGDVYRLGDAIVKVTQPREPCWKLARKWRLKDFALQVQQCGKTGWYLGVVQEGYIEAGDSFKLMERPEPNWTIARANHIMHEAKRDIDAARALANCQGLAASWVETLTRRAEKGEQKDPNQRLYGAN